MRSATRCSSFSLSSASARVLRNRSAKTRDLVAQDLRVERLRQVVDRARAVAAEHVGVLEHVRREEQDRDLAKPLRPLDDLRELDAVDARHLDVEDDRGDVVLEQHAQRAVGVLGAQHRVAVGVEHGLERIEVARLVVDQEQLDLVVEHQFAIVGHRYSHTRSSDRSWSVFTGFAM